MEVGNTTYGYGMKSTFAQLLAISGLCTLQMGLCAKDMFHYLIVTSYSIQFETPNLVYTLLGCAQSTLLLGRFGHRKCILLASAEYLAAELAAGLGDRQAWACLVALSEGASVGPCLAYVGEVCEPRLRSAVFAALLAIKSLSYNAIAVMYRQGLFWRERPVTAAAAVFPIATIAIMAFVTPDSPIWLLTKGEHAKARKSLRSLRGNVSDEACASELKDMVDYTFPATSHNALSASNTNDEDGIDDSSAWKQLLRPEVLKPFLKIIFHYIFINFLIKIDFTYYVLDFYTYIAKYEDLEWQWAPVSSLPFVGNVITIFLVNRFGKRFLTIFTLCTISCIFIIFELENMYDEYIVEFTTIIDYTDVGLTYLWFLMLAIGIEPITNMLITEVFPGKSRYITCNICSALIFITNYTLRINYDDIGEIIYNYILIKISNYDFHSILMTGIAGLIDCLYLYFYQIETENKTLHEIYQIIH